MRDIRGAWEGIRAIQRPYVNPVPKWHIRFGKLDSCRGLWDEPSYKPRRFRCWLHCWTPTWHRGRGPYFSIALGFVLIYREYREHKILVGDTDVRKELEK